MITKITGGKFISIVKVMVLIVLASFTSQVYAEYYVVYSPTYAPVSPVVVDPCTTCAVPTCPQAGCYKYKKYKTVAVRKRHMNRYNLTTYYVWPMYAGTLWVPRCGGDCTRWVSGYCGAPDCGDFYVPPEYFVTYPSPDTMDMGTADP